MIRAHFGIEKLPFSGEEYTLLRQQQEIYDTLQVHAHHGGLSLILGVPGTGKTVLKEYLIQQADRRRSLIATVGRTLHTYSNTTRILCQAFGVDGQGTAFKCEKLLIEKARELHKKDMTLITIIDDAHLLQMEALRKLRLLFEEFPKNHNLVLIGQTELLDSLSLSVNEDIRSRVTYSVVLKRLTAEDVTEFIFQQLDLCGLGHNVFQEGALELIVRSSDGVLRYARNLCLGSLLGAMRARTRTVSTDLVNEVLLQPHWRKEQNAI